MHLSAQIEQDRFLVLNFLVFGDFGEKVKKNWRKKKNEKKNNNDRNMIW